jgi:hypothetical protein
MLGFSLETKAKNAKAYAPEMLPELLKNAAKLYPQTPGNQSFKISLTKLLRRKAEAKMLTLTLPTPPEYIFKNDFWVLKLQCRGLPSTPCQLIARYIAKETYLMPPEVRGVWLRTNWNDGKLKSHVDLVRKIRLAMAEKPA